VEQLNDRIAVVTGGGTGMGRELVAQLAAAGCHVATCDLAGDALDETRRLALAGAPDGVRVTTHRADVAEEPQVLAFRDEVRRDHATDHVHLLFNNAGVAGGGSFVADPREQWERTFAIDWGGVYLVTRAFLPLLTAASEGHVINTSSINGVWASIGPSMPHTAYSAAKFAVRGFTEALICDFAMNAPHLRASVVLPGHVGTSIVLNSTALMSEGQPDDAERLERVRKQMAGLGLDAAGVSDEDLRKGMQLLGEQFRDAAPVTAAQAATTILDGVRANKWRILVGDDAVTIDEMVREDPEGAYDEAFFDALRARGYFSGFGL
jgi:NAD(P)-dependent dehydrogenase (short-subunit alcohol dehydrogenase family)